MIATLVRLKLTLLRNGLRRSPWQVVALVLGLLYAVSVVTVVGAGLVALRFTGADVAGAVVVGAGTLAVLGWALLPLVAFGVDETLDPARFATSAVPRRQLVPGLLLAGFVGLPGLVTLLLSLAAAAALARSLPAAAIAVAGALLGALTAVAASRASTTAAAALLRARRARDVVVLVVGLLVVLLGPGINLVAQRVEGGAGDLAGLGRDAAAVAGWTPPGFAWAAGADAAAGRWGTALLRLVLAAAVLAAVLGAWALALGRSGTGPATGGGPARSAAVRGGGLLERLPATPAGAVARRCLTYWRRDPRYLVSAGSLAVVPLLLVVLPLSAGDGSGRWLLATGPLVAFVTGWSLHDDVAYDHSAFALHVAAGVRGRDDRAGRVLAAAAWQVPVVLVLAVAGALVPGRADLLPAVLGACAALLGAGYGVSSVASALVPYPVAAPGGNPFSTPRGAATATVLVQLATTAATTVLALPALVALVLALTWTPWAGAAGLVVGLALGGLWTWLGVTRGGALLDRRAPEVLAVVSRS
ncbi:transporter [Kineococcus gypseus]|uniref:transporter n=1 Tax=Kineococcus gypseus TaxID=1637102 RepID=UPI003D7F00CC